MSGGKSSLSIVAKWARAKEDFLPAIVLFFFFLLLLYLSVSLAQHLLKRCKVGIDTSLRAEIKKCHTSQTLSPPLCSYCCLMPFFFLSFLFFFFF